ncbi:MAG: phosphate ABC transporter permease subunit PstC [Berryella intestinalis]|uniref:phosphate ABC transporter permease subunit PstC n=1 Tax=Berryella intestinalis TaxID=1531429 RepID=UPI000690FBE2|nr:phosphate ABC transporter permease subunit PstC [Berryella intestinalis]MDD7369502.1 phosphate ABC transporter permease subunit PstC [Berryella intestinalis]MDY3130080.1 phosphate ABC transporter permease subunit PstC [Berryella intestinalis]
MKPSLSENAARAAFTLAAWVCLALLLFVVLFIATEALPAFQSTDPAELLLSFSWQPIGFTGEPSFGIANFVAATLLVSALALAFASLIGVGTALFLSFIAPRGVRGVSLAAIEMLAGIPSVVYGFVGITLVVPVFLKAGVHTGTCVLAASLVLAIMIAPYLVSTLCDSLAKRKERYLDAALSLGIDRWDAIATIILPTSAKSITVAMLLAWGRAMGETMAVMMVIGNANLFPRLLGKAETIPALIALEMGGAQADSAHYHALYAAAFVLVCALLAINVAGNLVKSRFEKSGVL